jgi:hypothetical protein
MACPTASTVAGFLIIKIKIKWTFEKPDRTKQLIALDYLEVLCMSSMYGLYSCTYLILYTTMMAL